MNFFDIGQYKYLCPSTDVWVSKALPNTDKDGISEAIVTQEDHGFALWACQGTIDGVLMAPVQPFSLPVVSPDFRSTVTWANLPSLSDSLPHTERSPLLQPPRV